ncbi:MAG: hypothetical protein Q7T05_04730 [Dehalococcoidia bacterium]|nr:hypothetical protein [Dehalococcoidia bacterium]
MPEHPQKNTSVQTKGAAKLQRVPVTLALGPSRDVPIQWANKVVVNFIGSEFIVSILAAAPEPFLTAPVNIPRKLEAKILARYAVSVPEWAAAVGSFAKQIEGLQEEGVFALEIENVDEAKH